MQFAVPLVDSLPLSLEEEAEKICKLMAESLRQQRRRGVVLGVSGGVDSALCAALAARAVGPDKVLCLMMPDRDTPDHATARARALCDQLGVVQQIEDISASLEALGCYERRNQAIRRLVPDYGPDHRSKIVIASGMMDKDRVNFFELVVEAPDGTQSRVRMPPADYLQVVAATNFKQRIRKTMEYYHADRLNYAVLGTPNRLEYELGFFVRGGDGLADIKPIAHLFKSQVFALADYLGVSQDILSQTPSTDTYSLTQTQEEFYFGLPLALLDQVLAGYLAAEPVAALATRLGLSMDAVERIFRDIRAKRRQAARCLAPAAMVTAIDPGEEPTCS